MTAQATTAPFDEAKLGAFMERALGDASGDLGADAALLPALVRPRARAALDPGGSRPAAAARAARELGGRGLRLRRGGAAARRGVPPLGVRGLRRLRAPAHARPPGRRRGRPATLLYGVSINYCLATSLAAGGAGLGTCGLPAARVGEMCARAGFGAVEAIELGDPLNALYAVRP